MEQLEERRVLVLCQTPLFCEVVQVILRAGGIEPVGVEMDKGQLVKCIESLRPDVVLVEAEGGSIDAPLTISYLQEEKLTLKMISLSLRNNEMHIYRYDRQHGVVASKDDLLAAIRAP